MISEQDFLTMTEPQEEMMQNNEMNTFTAKQIHITIKQRTVRKCYTLVHGIPEDIDLPLVLKEWKNRFNCAGAVKKDKDKQEEFIELFGDHRNEVKEFLIYEGIGTKENVIVHGLN